MTDVDPKDLACAKAELRRNPEGHLDAFYCGVPVEAFDREDLVLMAKAAFRALDGYRSIGW